jgi:hypothetical protein
MTRTKLEVTICDRFNRNIGVAETCIGSTLFLGKYYILVQENYLAGNYGDTEYKKK